MPFFFFLLFLRKERENSVNEGSVPDTVLSTSVMLTDLTLLSCEPGDHLHLTDEKL